MKIKNFKPEKILHQQTNEAYLTRNKKKKI